MNPGLAYAKEIHTFIIIIMCFKVVRELIRAVKRNTFEQEGSELLPVRIQQNKPLSVMKEPLQDIIPRSIFCRDEFPNVIVSLYPLICYE